VTELRRAIPFLLLPLLLLAAGCSLLPGRFAGTTTPSGPPVANAAAAGGLVDHRAIWTKSGVKTYRLELRFACECAAAEPVAVTVVDGTVTEVRTPDGADATKTYGAFPLTVDAIYQQATDALANGGSVTARYGDGGIPTAVSIDPIPNAIDDELGIDVLGFTPGP
jgi:hypothetical protein